MWATIFQPGFFASDEVRTALIVGALVAVVSGVVGVFTVLRGQSFAGHSLADVGASGGSGAYLIAAPPLWGFLVFSVAGAALMDLIGIQRGHHDAKDRDLATGIVLGAALGLAALFLHWDTTTHASNGQAMTVLFGSIFAIGGGTIPLVVIFSAISMAAMALVFRPLLLSGLHPDLARAQHVRVRLVGWVYLAALAIAVALSSVAIGSILSTALLIGPAATAVRLTRRPGLAMLWAALLGVLAMWLGVLLSYDSYTWPPAHHGWPVSFLVVALIVFAYLLAEVVG
jgi:zinc/manganese transport system permease protein